MDSNIIQGIIAYIINNINEEISIDSIADEFHYNRFHLMRKFKEITGFTINEFINECRIYNSTDPLIFTDDTILKIALNNGFNSLEYYSEKFKDIIGLSPTKFRRIYTSLIYIAKTSKDKEELETVKQALNELKAYQEYLNTLGVNTAEEEANIQEKPQVKIIKDYTRKVA